MFGEEMNGNGLLLFLPGLCNAPKDGGQALFEWCLESLMLARLGPLLIDRPLVLD